MIASRFVILFSNAEHEIVVVNQIEMRQEDFRAAMTIGLSKGWIKSADRGVANFSVGDLLDESADNTIQICAKKIAYFEKACSEREIFKPTARSLCCIFLRLSFLIGLAL